MEKDRIGLIGSRADAAVLARSIIFAGIAAMLLVAVVLLAVPRSAVAEDELYLTGVVKSVNPEKGIVYVDVLSDSCHGMRMFRADRLEYMENFVNQKVSFFIDSDHCDADSVPVILVSRGVLK